MHRLSTIVSIHLAVSRSARDWLKKWFSRRTDTTAISVCKPRKCARAKLSEGASHPSHRNCHHLSAVVASWFGSAISIFRPSSHSLSLQVPLVFLPPRFCEKKLFLSTDFRSELCHLVICDGYTSGGQEKRVIFCHKYVGNWRVCFCSGQETWDRGWKDASFFSFSSSRLCYH